MDLKRDIEDEAFVIVENRGTGPEAIGKLLFSEMFPILPMRMGQTMKTTTE